MSEYSLYSNSESASSSDYASTNTVTIARALNNKLLTKTIYNGGEKAYDNAYHYKFFNRDIQSLGELLQLTTVLLTRPQCCLLRGVCKDDTVFPQRRLFHGDEATIIEQPQNWYALDIDGYGNSSGILKEDTKKVLLALGLSNTEAFAIPSAGYLRKPGIRIRLFLWNNERVTCASLKKHFTKLKDVVDLALFHPIQPIYTARPIFSGSTDPCKERVAWITGNPYTEIKEQYSPGAGRKEELYTKKQAERFLNNFMVKCGSIVEGERHSWLFGVSVALGKWIYQELLDEEDVVEEMYLATRIWGGNAKKDMQTILDGIKEGKRAMDEQQYDF